MPKVEHLDKDCIEQLLAEADRKWLSAHCGQFNYREHLEFRAKYVAKNYNRKKEKDETKSAHSRAR